MKKTFLSVGLCVLFLLFSGCIHGSLDISIPDGITTRMSGDQNYTYYFHSEGGYADTISGTFTATCSCCEGDCCTGDCCTGDCCTGGCCTGGCCTGGCATTYTATYACLTYTIEDSASVKKNYRSYSFLVGGVDESGSYKEFLCGEIVYVNNYGTTTTLADYTIVTNSGEYGYDEYRQKEFDLDITWDAGDPESITSSSSFCSYTVQFNCHFKRTSD